MPEYQHPREAYEKHTRHVTAKQAHIQEVHTSRSVWRWACLEQDTANQQTPKAF